MSWSALALLAVLGGLVLLATKIGATQAVVGVFVAAFSAAAARAVPARRRRSRARRRARA